MDWNRKHLNYTIASFEKFPVLLETKQWGFTSKCTNNRAEIS